MPIFATPSWSLVRNDLATNARPRLAPCARWPFLIPLCRMCVSSTAFAPGRDSSRNFYQRSY